MQFSLFVIFKFWWRIFKSTKYWAWILFCLVWYLVCVLLRVTWPRGINDIKLINPCLFYMQYIPRNIETVHTFCGLVLLDFYPYPSGLLHWHWGNHTIAPVSVKQPRRIWVNGSHGSPNYYWYNLNQQNISKLCAYSMGYIQVHKITPVFMGRQADDIYIYVCPTIFTYVRWSSKTRDICWFNSLTSIISLSEQLDLIM